MSHARVALRALLVLCPAIGFADNAGSAHAMDFDIGLWKTHSSRLMHPLTGSTEWKDTDGYTRVMPIWHGRANIAEYNGDGPAGHVELLALRTYDPTTNQWYLNFSHPGTGTLDVPGVGAAKNGRIISTTRRLWQERSSGSVSQSGESLRTRPNRNRRSPPTRARPGR